MFRETELEMIDSSYFNVICKDEKDVTIQSRNSKHWWYLHSAEACENGACVIYHKHKFTHPYHQHGKAINLNKAMRQIQ